MFQIQVETDAKVPGLNPTRGYDIDRSELEIILGPAGVNFISPKRQRFKHQIKVIFCFKCVRVAF